MAYEISARASILSRKTNVEQQFILEIDGIDIIFGALSVSKIVRYGDDVEYGDPGVFYGGSIPNPNGRDWISLDGTTKKISQKLDQDRGGTGSITSLNVQLLDKNEELSSLFQPGNVVSDILGRKARFYISFKDGAHPEDSVLIFNGLIQKIGYGAGNVTLQIGNPEQLKRQTLFDITKTELNGNISAGDTVIPLKTTSGLILPQDAISSYVRINDELVQYTGISGNSITGCVRGQLNTIADSHSLNDSVEAFYRLQGPSVDLALKLMLSNAGNTEYLQGLEILSFGRDGLDVINSAIFYEGFNINTRYGVAVGDTITVTGASTPSNNGTFTIIDIQPYRNGSYVIVDAPITIELDTTAVSSFLSQYNTLSEGLSMTPDLVDVAGHKEILRLFGSSFLDQDIYIKEEVNGKDFIAERLYYPNGLYQIPRKGRSGVGFTSPPLATVETKTLNLNNVENAERLVINRSVTNDFYNAVSFKYNQDSIEDNFLSGLIIQSARSTNRIPIGNRPLIIEAPGIRPGISNSENQLLIQGRRFIDRYQYGAESISLTTNFENFNIEVGDTVILEGEELKLSDSSNGSRDFAPRIMEVTNSSLNIVDGRLQLELTDTAYELDGRYGVISPSSNIGTGSTQRRIVIENSFSTPDFGAERIKWADYVNQKLIIHSEDWSFQEEATLLEIDVASGNVLVLQEDLSISPPAGYIVDINIYPDNADEKDQRFLKALHCHFNPQVTIVSGISQNSFTVSASDAALFVIGRSVQVHNEDYSIDSGDIDTVVSSVVGSIITLDVPLGFVPAAGQFAELIGYPDSGQPYRIL